MKQKPYLSRYEFEVQNLLKINSTMITKSGEPSDDDEYHLDSTVHTKSRESSDPDEYYSFGTTMTRTLEDSDPDFFLVQRDN